MIVYIFATRSEAAPFIELSKSKKLDTDDSFNGAVRRKLPMWQTQEGNIVALCGMGPKKAGRNVSAILQSLKSHTVNVVNCGICGSLREQYGVGDLCLVSRIYNGDDVLTDSEDTNIPIDTDHVLSIQKRLQPFLKQATLATTSFGVFGGNPKRKLARVADIVDMEGYSICKVCKKKDLCLTVIKGVSDFADSHGKQAIQENIHQLSEKLATILIKTEQ